jgi:RHS repeat-associated protein
VTGTQRTLAPHLTACGSSAGVTYTQGWDVENRLIAVTATTGSAISVTQFVYDGDGSRVLQLLPDGSRTAYAGALEVTITSTQRITKTYYFAGSQLIAMRVITTGGNALYYLHGDHLGSTSLTTDQSGSVVARQLYDAWGNVRLRGDLKTDLGYTSQREDRGTNLMFYQARYYSPALSRFLSADTLVPNPNNPQSFNRFSYTYNNPVKYTDPSGHYTEDEIMKSLIDQYGEDEANRIWKLWLYDSWWMWALYRAQDGSKIWASLTGWMGTFDRNANGRIVINFMTEGVFDYPTDLYNWQGLGAYLIESANGEQYDLGTSCENMLCYQPVYSYDRSGRIIGDTPQSERSIVYARTLFGWTMFGLSDEFAIRGAPWNPSYKGEDEQNLALDIGASFAHWGIGFANTIRAASDVFYDLIVMVDTGPVSNPGLYQGDPWAPIVMHPPDAFKDK